MLVAVHGSAGDQNLALAIEGIGAYALRCIFGNAKEPPMCKIFVRANPQSYEATTRSVRLLGVVTRVRLENLF